MLKIYASEVILSGRNTNDKMVEFVGKENFKEAIKKILNVFF